MGNSRHLYSMNVDGHQIGINRLKVVTITSKGFDKPNSVAGSAGITVNREGG